MDFVRFVQWLRCAFGMGRAATDPVIGATARLTIACGPVCRAMDNGTGGPEAMNTPAHLLVGLALCARAEVPRSGRWASVGGLLPDMSLYLLAGGALFLMQIPPERVFNELYFSPAWQGVFAIDNSFLLWGFAAALAWAWQKRLGMAFALAGLLHVATDFPLHNDDARPHFWPLSDWVFESPLSYWDSNHYASIVAPVELIVVLVAGAVIWRRWTSWPARVGVALGCALEFWVVRQWLVFF